MPLLLERRQSIQKKYCPLGETEIFIFLMNSLKSRWVFKILTIKIMNNFHPMFNGTSCISMSTNQASKQALILEGAIKEFRGFKATLLKKCQIEKNRLLI